MMRFYLVGFAFLLGFDSFSQIAFKFAGDQALPVQASSDWLLRLFTNPWIYGAVLGYLGSFVTWMSLLKRAPIGPAFAASHLEIISVMLLSVWIFGDQLSAGKLLGAALILAGIVCLALAEQQEITQAQD